MSAPEKDFFISYTSADRRWAEWIAWCLEQAGYSIILQAWDFPAGSNFVHEMDQALGKASRVVAVLSPAYINSEYGFSEWTEVFRRDPQGKQRLLLPVRVEPCETQGLLGAIVYCDLVECDEEIAQQRLLAGAHGKQPHPISVPFPGASRVMASPPRFPGGLPPIWNIPYQRNTFFTGRAELLTRLATALTAGQAMALSQAQAISGLGGIRKTQIAVEYAYEHRQDYQAVLWATASSTERLVSSYVTIAGLLNLPEKDDQDQMGIVRAVVYWLTTHSKWLLILDNADDLALVYEFLPQKFDGHILLTTRAQATDRLANRIEVDAMPQDTGALFLLRRAKILTLDVPLEDVVSADVVNAREICVELGGLPLALDQAGAYIEEVQCSLSEYQQRYRIRRNLLLKRRGGLVPDHPEPVATTWSLSFEKVEQICPAAGDLLRFCAFLAADAIPEEIITEGAVYLGELLQPITTDPLLLDDAISALGAYSLVRRDAKTKTFNIHRLVQAVMRDALSVEEGQKWMRRAVCAVSTTFPNAEFAQWAACKRCLPHALICAGWIEQAQMVFLMAVGLLHRTAFYLNERAQYAEAEVLYQRALEINEKQLGGDHPNTAASLNNLAALYKTQGKYVDAEPLLKRALEIDEQQFGTEHPSTAITLNNLANLYQEQGKYIQAEPLMRRVLEISEKQLGADHPDTARSLNNLAMLYEMQDKYVQAESLLKRALAIREKQLGVDHPDTATSLNNLAGLYQDQGKYVQAEPLYQRALEIKEKQLGTDHPDTATSLNNLALLYNMQGKYTEAEPLYQWALEIREKQLGADHPDTALSLSNLAGLYQEQRKYVQAEPLYQRALEIREKQLGPDHHTTMQLRENYRFFLQRKNQEEQTQAASKQLPESLHPSMASDLNDQAVIYHNQGNYEQAELLYREALTLRKQQLGSQHPDTARSFNNLATLYEEQGRYLEAEPLYRQALSICELQLGSQHPATRQVRENYKFFIQRISREWQAASKQVFGSLHLSIVSHLNNLALLYQAQGNYEQEEQLYQLVLSIREQQLGSQHLDTALSLNNLATLYEDQEKYLEAEPLLMRVLEIYEKQLGVDHSDTATGLNNLAALYEKQGKYAQAEPLYQRALKINEKQLGPDHHTTMRIRENYTSFLQGVNQEKQVQAASKRIFESLHPSTASDLNDQAVLYHEQGNYEQAEAFYWEALTLRKQQLGSQHPDTALSFNNLATLFEEQGRYLEAEPLYRQALSICELQLGSRHSTTRQVRENYRIFIQRISQEWQTASNKQMFESLHPSTASHLNNLALLYHEQGNYEQEEQLYQLVLSIRKQQLGSQHLDTALSLNDLAILYDEQGRYLEAEPLYRQALAICEKQLGADDNQTKVVRENYADLQRKLSDGASETSSMSAQSAPSVLQEEKQLPAVTPPPTFPSIWNIPYSRNAFFTGQDDLLTHLSTTLTAGQATALSQPQAISRLGGIGKTQIAVEFAYQHRQDFQTVLWVLADTRESLVSGYITIARLLNLPQKEAQDQQIIIEAVKNWLQTHGSWLLILDNADHLETVHEFIPAVFGGHLLLTTRAQSMDRLAKRIEVETMNQDVGALFLLRRLGLIAENASLDTGLSSDVTIAREIARELGGLPLALDQAGVFIAEAQCSLTEYLLLYRTRRTEILKKRGALVNDHPEPVATTWSISFEQVAEKNPATADLLRFCAFLAPDAIPEDLFVAGAKHLGPLLQPLGSDPLSLNKALAALEAYSLIRRNGSEKTLSMHRLVQAVLRDAMNEQMRQLWAERTVQAVNEGFPYVEFKTWSQCERCLPHALVCAVWIEQEQINSQEAARLLYNAGYYLNDRARYVEAELFYLQALSIYEKQLGVDHPNTVTSLNRLVLLYDNQGKYAQAELLYRRALSISEQQLGASHLHTATSLNNLAVLYRSRGKDAHAEPLLRRALEIKEQQLGASHPNTAMSLNNLADLYDTQGKYAQAESLYRRALEINEKQLGASHPNTAMSLNNLAVLYENQGKYTEAEPLYKQALLICEQALGPDHPDTQSTRRRYISLLRKMGRDEEADSLGEQVIRSRTSWKMYF